MKPKKISIKDLQEDAFNLYYHKEYSPSKIAKILGRSPRTIYRWIKTIDHIENDDPKVVGRKKSNRNIFPQEIFVLIKKLKQEIPARSASKIQTLLKERNMASIPSVSTIRKYIAKEGLSSRKSVQHKGYVKFERKYPNDLWQIDIAGVQSIENIGKVYLFAVLDDCSRYIPAAFYAKNEKGYQVIELLRQGFIAYGRPRQILADNGAQFRNLIGELGTKYSRLLHFLDVDPIFAKPYHPQTKGKLERWFGTVVKSFLPEVRFKAKSNPKFSLNDLNIEFKEWLNWYNTQKPHRSLPRSTNPANIYFNKEGRLYHPLKHQINWVRWLGESNTRKVSKYNEIKYKGVLFAVPPGYSGLRINLLDFDGKIEVFYLDQKICEHSLPDFSKNINNKSEIRKINKTGMIRYKGKGYSIDYKLEGKKVEVKETNDGSILLVYFQNTLLKQFTIA